MLRIFAAIIVLGLSATLAQAGDDALTTRVHDAASRACAPERASVNGPAGHYGAIYDQCVTRISRAAMTRYRADARARRELANNRAVMSGSGQVERHLSAVGH